MSEELTLAEAEELVGDDIAYWMSNPFMGAEERTAKVLWWLGRVSR